EALVGAVRATSRDTDPRDPATPGDRPELIASGGLRDGVEGATCLALGATAVGFARELLLAAQDDRADEAVGVLIRQLRIATWLTGAATSAELTRAHLQEATR
ncbi:MAG: alpha-hydroxy-acid oxidizing protein, partial [Solirubrobacteraceae bacterium]|nr:alpha-hydroxy-acid oxidizing protein [Solirubrobacteraceae bacterium]